MPAEIKIFKSTGGSKIEITMFDDGEVCIQMESHDCMATQYLPEDQMKELIRWLNGRYHLYCTSDADASRSEKS